ncbi:MAG: SigE family RNA polymerase sigma factor [Jatrophihabitantaceae bacterium]
MGFLGDDAFSDFVQQHGAELLRFAYLLCDDPGRAEDIVQDALLNVLRQWRSSAPSHPVAYTRKAILNEYLGWKRRRASREVIGTEPFDPSAPDGSGEIAARDLVWRLICDLPPRARAVLVLRYYEQLPDREIAAHLGCAEATVRSIAARAFTTLRSHPQLSVLESKEA